MEPRSTDLNVTRAGIPPFELSGLVASAQQVAAPSARRSALVMGSVAVHALAVSAIVAAPLLRDTSLPDPAEGMNAIFVTPHVELPAPPPPPPPAKVLRAVEARRAQADAESSAFVAPVEIPDLVDGMNDIDLGIEGGVAGGVEGGVAGGVVGGIVGGTLEAEPRPEPVRAGFEVSEPRKLVHVNPVYPSVARKARVQGVVVIDCLIDLQGRVTEAHVIEGVSVLNAPALEAVKQWRYTPTLYGGVPVPVKMTVKVRFRLS